VGTFYDPTACPLANSYGVGMPCVKPQWGGGAACVCCSDLYEYGCVPPAPAPPAATPAPPAAPGVPPPGGPVAVSLSTGASSLSVTAEQELVLTFGTPARLLTARGSPLLDLAVSGPSPGTLEEDPAGAVFTPCTDCKDASGAPLDGLLTRVTLRVRWAPDAGASPPVRLAGTARVRAGVFDAPGAEPNLAGAEVPLSYDGSDPELAFVAPAVTDGFTRDRVFPVEMRANEAAAGWDWGRVLVEGGSVSFPSPSLRSTMDGATVFRMVLTFDDSGGSLSVTAPAGLFRDAAGRPSRRATFAAGHTKDWAEATAAASTAVTASSVASAGASSVVTSAVASSAAAGSAGGAGAVAGAANAAVQGIGAGAGAGGAGGVGAGMGGGAVGGQGAAGLGAGSSVAGPSQLSATVQSHILAMVFHVQFTAVLSDLREGVPDGLRAFSSQLEWTNLQFDGLPWQPGTDAPAPATTPSPARRLADVAEEHVAASRRLRGLGGAGPRPVCLEWRGRPRGLLQADAGGSAEGIASEDDIIAAAIDRLTSPAATEEQVWSNLYTRLSVALAVLLGIAGLRAGAEAAWYGWRQRGGGVTREELAPQVPAVLLFPKAELMGYAATMSGMTNACGALIGTGTPAGVAVGAAGVLLWNGPILVFVTHFVIVRWVIRERRAEFVVEEDELGNRKDTLTVRQVPGEWREKDPRGRFLERYGHLFCQHAGATGTEERWVRSRLEPLDQRREARAREAESRRVMRVAIAPEPGADPEDPNAEFAGPLAASFRKGRRAETARDGAGGGGGGDGEGEGEEERPGMPGAGPVRRGVLLLLLPLRVRPYEVRLLHWTVATSKVVLVALLAGMSPLLPRLSVVLVAGVALLSAGFTFVFMPFTEAGEMLVELFSVSVEAVVALLVCGSTFAPSWRGSEAVDAAVVALTMLMLASHMGYQVYMMAVVRLMASFYRDNQVLSEKRARELEDQRRADDLDEGYARRAGGVAPAGPGNTGKVIDIGATASGLDDGYVEDDI